jgi:SAM-dependent methyltransferase
VYRLKRMANLAFGKVLDIGFADQPNPYLQGEVIGFDRKAVAVPSNYQRTITGDVTDLAGISEHFDTILAGEIIEHLEYPIEFIANCFALLKPGGRLVLSTPNPYYPPLVWLERLMIRRFFYSEEHLYIFLPRFLTRLMEQQGFQNIAQYSGGIIIPFLNIELPWPRAFCYAIIYVGENS